MYPRYSEARVRTALRDTRVVAISGPRQSGKTTLARRLSKKNRPYFTLDNQSTLAAATSDPVAFIRGLDLASIDEVQRAPELVLAIKESVDQDNRPGRFLLTGSANLLTIATVRESLAGRVEIIPLYPLSCSERRRIRKPQFLSRIFKGKSPRTQENLSADRLLKLVTAGGYPDALKRRSERRRQDWYRAYVDSVIERDLPEIAKVDKPAQIPQVLLIASRFAGQLTNQSEIGRSAGIDHKTAAQYLRILEQLYLIQSIKPWSRNELGRMVKSPKLHFVDSGLLTALRGYSSTRLRTDRTAFGALLETFVFSELLKLSSWAEDRISIFHYRDRDKIEVDFVLEDAVGRVVGIEVKSAESVRRDDFKGLERLSSAAGDAFIQGILLYTGKQTLPFGEKLCAVPLPALWA